MKPRPGRYGRLMDAPSMDHFHRCLAEAGWRESEAYEGYGFGSWLIELGWDLRVAYDGKDERLELSRATSQDNWRITWTSSGRSELTPAALLEALRDYR
jgi:hypothetical protein